ncbi:MAG TPA: hypothetical protein VIH42_14570 [Thermoguttaceae bacterium]
MADIEKYPSLILGQDEIAAAAGIIDRFFLVIIFGKTNSYVYEQAVNIAKSATHYSEIKSKKNILHVAAFEATRASAKPALMLARYIEGWKSAYIFTKGQITSSYRAVMTLNCYTVATECVDYSAHCHEVIDDLNADQHHYYIRDGLVQDIKKYLFPCKLLRSYFRFQPKHPSGTYAQIQAAAVSFGCSWCPYFDEKNYKQINDIQK